MREDFCVKASISFSNGWLNFLNAFALSLPRHLFDTTTHFWQSLQHQATPKPGQFIIRLLLAVAKVDHLAKVNATSFAGAAASPNARRLYPTRGNSMPSPTPAIVRIAR
jgi:hypothetical protein